MKKQSFKFRTILTGLALASVMAVATVPASAKDKKQDSVSASITPVVEYIGSDDNSSLFTVAFGNATPVKFELTVNDAQGTQIFSQEFEAAKFSKYFKLVNEGTGDSQDLSFTIHIFPNGATHTFNVSNSTKLEKNVTVTKL